jgi:hypothetical protein
MSGITRRAILGVLFTAPILFTASILLAQTTATPDADTASPPNPAIANQKPEPRHKSHKTGPGPSTPAVLPPLPSGPLSQMPMDQIPPTPAKVTFQNGLLTISAQNSTLAEILRDVRKLTGASIEFPSGSNGANEHVVTHLGPAAPRDVLVGLLNGSSFNYVMLGSNADPTAVASVILTPKEPVAGQTQTAANVYQNTATAVASPNRFPVPRPFNPQAGVPQPGTGVVAQPDDGNANDDQENAEDTAAANGEDQTQQAEQPDTTDATTAVQQQQPTDPNQPNAGPRTPEQILEMLRRPQQPGAVVTNPQQPPQEQQ